MTHKQERILVGLVIDMACNGHLYGDRYKKEILELLKLLDEPKKEIKK